MARRRRKKGFRIRFKRKFPFVQFGAVTKQDFVAIANILCGTRAPNGTVEAMANYFATSNPRFDRARFEKAATCGVGRPHHNPWKAD